MEKIKLNTTALEYRKIDGGILVKPYATIADKRIILNALFESDNIDNIERSLENKAGLMLSVLDRMTNVDIENVDLELLVASGLWDKIKSNISNFSEIYGEYKELKEEKSLPVRINNLIEKVETFIDGLSDLDLSQESIQSSLKDLTSGLSQLSTVYPQLQDKPKKSKKITP